MHVHTISENKNHKEAVFDEPVQEDLESQNIERDMNREAWFGVVWLWKGTKAIGY